MGPRACARTSRKLASSARSRRTLREPRRPLLGSYCPQPWPLQEHRDGDRQAGGWLIAARAHLRQLSSELQTRGGPILTLAIWSQFDPYPTSRAPALRDAAIVLVLAYEI